MSNSGPLRPPVKIFSGMLEHTVHTQLSYLGNTSYFENTVFDVFATVIDAKLQTLFPVKILGV